MEHRLLDWRRTVAFTLLLAAAGTASLHAQEAASATGAKMRVLVPNLDPLNNAKNKFGEDVAESVRKQLGTMQRHVGIDKKEMQAEVKALKLKEDEMDCMVQYRQLAIRMNAELLVCGEYWPEGTAHSAWAQFINAKTGDAFVVDTLTAANAKEASDQIFQQFQRFVEHIGLAGFCYEYLGSEQWDRALENCNNALAINANAGPALKGKAMALFRQGTANAQEPDQAKLNEALGIYKKVLELNPVDQEALRQAGIVSARIGNAQESREYFRQYLEMNPGDVAVRISIANDQARAGDPEGALRVVEEGLKTDESNTDLRTFAGVYAAQAAYKIQSEKQELTPEAKALYAVAYTHYKNLFDTREGDVEPAVIKQMITTLVVLDRAAEAVEVGSKGTQTKAESGAVWAAYAGALAQVNRVEEAVAAFDKAIALNDTTETGLRGRKATILLTAGRIEAARSAVREAITAGETTGDEVADLVWRVTMNDEYQKKSWDAALRNFEVAGEFATSASMKSQLAFWSGMIHYQKAAAIKTPETAAQARTARPSFVRALETLEAGAAYGRATPNSNYAATVDNIRKYIEYLDALIKAGR